MTRSNDLVERSLELAAAGLSTSEVARRIGVPRSTVCDWLSGLAARLVARWPALLLRGLIHSDGCRFQNTGRGWSHPRYSFANNSAGIRTIFCDACELMGLRWTASGSTKIYVSRKADVAILDRFVGPKS